MHALPNPFMTKIPHLSHRMIIACAVERGALLELRSKQFIIMAESFEHGNETSDCLKGGN
jgi:hypothetical protein